MLNVQTYYSHINSLPLKYSAVRSSEVARSTKYRPSQLPIHNQLLSLQGPTQKHMEKQCYRVSLKSIFRSFGERWCNHILKKNILCDEWQGMHTIGLQVFRFPLTSCRLNYVHAATWKSRLQSRKKILPLGGANI